jgi:hypothetical protein
MSASWHQGGAISRPEKPVAGGQLDRYLDAMVSAIAAA